MKKTEFGVKNTVLAAMCVVVLGMVGCGDNGGNPIGDGGTTRTLTVIANPANGGTVSPTGESTHDNKAKVAVKATPANGYTFTGWTGAPSGINASNASITVTMNSNLALVANFEIDNTNPMTPLRAEPVAADDFLSKPIKPLDSWTDGVKNWYVIDAGYIRNSLIMQLGPTRFQGVGEVKLTTSETVETSMTTSRTETVSKSIVIAEGTTHETRIDEAWTTKGGGGLEWKIFKVEGSVEKTITNSSGTSRTIETTRGNSLETSESFVETLTKWVSNATEITINREDPAGYYRYAWYTVSDVYFVISTSLDRQDLLSWDVVSCPGTVTEQGLEYASDGKFDNSPIDSLIIFPDEFWKTLPLPSSGPYTLTAIPTTGGTVSRDPDQINYTAGTQVTVTATPNAGYVFSGWTGAPMGVDASNASITFDINSGLILTASFRELIKKDSTIEFSNPGVYSVTFDKDMIESVEIYALGAGGGGQGGHWWILNSDGTGGSGGGGSAVYAKLIVEEHPTFSIEVGKGGSGGGKRRNGGLWGWDSGNSGGPGAPTKVTWNNKGITFTANGGGGGYRSGVGGGNARGGSGGLASDNPNSPLVPVWISRNGTSGQNGSDWSCAAQNTGGGSGLIPADTGSLTVNFGGSRGGYKTCSNPETTIYHAASIGAGGTGGYGDRSNGDGKSGGDGQVKIVVRWHEQ